MKSVVFPGKKTVEFLESIATGWFSLVPRPSSRAVDPLPEKVIFSRGGARRGRPGYEARVGLLSCSKKSAESSTPGDSAEWNLTTMYFPSIWVPVCERAIKILLGGKGTKLFGTHGNSIRMKKGFL